MELKISSWARIHLELPAAFDTVDQEELWPCLRTLAGVDGVALEWFPAWGVGFVCLFVFGVILVWFWYFFFRGFRSFDAFAFSKELLEVCTSLLSPWGTAGGSPLLLNVYERPGGGMRLPAPKFSGPHQGWNPRICALPGVLFGFLTDLAQIFGTAWAGKNESLKQVTLVGQKKGGDKTLLPNVGRVKASACPCVCWDGQPRTSPAGSWDHSWIPRAKELQGFFCSLLFARQREV